MGRILGANIKNALRILDEISGKAITLYYRLPTASERIAYESAHFQTKDGKVTLNTVAARQEFGLKILEGFEKGAFQVPAPDGSNDGSLIDISSDPDDPAYRADWKELVEKHAIDLVEVLAYRVFEGHKILSEQIGDQRKNS